jgi:hypothetical protein
MAQGGFGADPDHLDGVAEALQPLGPGLTQRAGTLLSLATRAGAANPGFYTSAALDMAAQQLRPAFESAAARIDGFRSAAKANADEYRAADQRVQRHLRQLLDQV